MALEPKQGNWASSRVDLAYTEISRIPAMTSMSFLTCDSVLGYYLEFCQGNQGS